MLISLRSPSGSEFMIFKVNWKSDKSSNQFVSHTLCLELGGRTNFPSQRDRQASPEGLGFLELGGANKRRLGWLEKWGGGYIPDIAYGMRKHQIWSGTNRWRRCQVLRGGVEGSRGYTQGHVLTRCWGDLAESQMKKNHPTTQGTSPAPS